MSTARTRWALVLVCAAAAASCAVPILVPLGTPLLELEAPVPGEVVGLSGVEVMVRFPRVDRVAPETFRALLNGADVSEAFTTADNGAHGQLVGLLEGENILRVEVFGRLRWLPGWYVDRGSEVVVFQRSPVDVHRG